MKASVGWIVTKLCVLGQLLLLVSTTACSSPSAPRTTLLRFEGVVSAEDGGPLAGAKVSLVNAFFLWAGPVDDAWTDANGRYSLEHSVECVRNEDLYHGRVSAYYLVASADGHWNRGSRDLERTLRCVTVMQRLDFVLPPVGSLAERRLERRTEPRRDHTAPWRARAWGVTRRHPTGSLPARRPRA